LCLGWLRLPSWFHFAPIIEFAVCLIPIVSAVWLCVASCFPLDFEPTQL
jgi:hypothetical protein